MRLAFVCVAALSVFLFASLGRSQNKNDPYAEHIAPGGPKTPEEERKAFHLPPGFEAQLVAAEPDIYKPMNIAFDAHGRLWVTESVEYPFPAPEGKKGRDAVKILEDFGPDGRARKITTFADGLNIPIGVLPVPHGALVYSIPNIWRLTDTEGKGRADKRDVFVGTIGHNDTHGMTNSFTWGFDGWIYATHGFSNTSTLKGSDGKAITMNSGNTYRMRPDGSHVEQFTWGQVNPFGLTFDPLGNLFSADCHTKPIMMLLRGAYYDSFGKPHDGLGYGPEMMGNYPDSTAIAGIAYYAADHYPAAYHGQVFIGDVVTCRVNEFRLQWRGSSPWATKHDFWLSDDRWFRPVAIQLGPDGALYVADFYNRIIGHYEVPLDHPGRDRERGRIWRIVYRGKDGKGEPHAPPDLTKASVAELVEYLGHPNLAIRVQATNQLVNRGGKEVADAVRAIMGPSGSNFQRVHGLWVMERMHVLDWQVLAAAADDDEREVRVHAMRVLSERKELTDKEHTLLLAGLKDKGKDPFVQRCAADALGRHPDVENLSPLLALRQAVPAADTHLLHTVRMAIRDTLRLPAAWNELAKLSENDQKAIADVAPGVPTAESAAYLVQHLQKLGGDLRQLLTLIHHIARYGDAATSRQLLALVRAHHPDQLGKQAALFQSVEQGVQERGAALDADALAWGKELTDKLLASSDGGEVRTGIRIAGSLRLKDTQPKLTAIAGEKSPLEHLRIEAVKSLALLDERKHVPLFGRILADAAEPVALREETAHALARLNHEDALGQLVHALPLVPARLQTIIAADLAGTRAGGEKLLEAVATGKASARLLQERFVEVRLAGTKIPKLKERLAKLTEGLPPADQRMQALFKKRKAGFTIAKADAAQGAKVYEKNCANCHQLGGKGAKVGPQLDGIGVRGVDRLLEDILDPNRNVDQAFRATTLGLKDGQSLSGLLLREEGEVLVLADAQGKEVRVPKNTVEERSTSQLSPMPANLVDQIAEQDFYHLLAFLLEQRAPKDGK
jgi:putative heme-binding domain-containing protein